MSIFKRNLLVKLPVFGMLALAAACGGGDDKAGENTDAAPSTETAAPAPAPAAGTETAAPAAQGNVIEVKMVTTQNGASGQFEPSTITARKGDTIRFTAD